MTNALEINDTGCHKLSLHFMDKTSPVAKFKASASTLNFLFISGVANIGLVVKTCFSCSNAFFCSSFHLYFSSFLVSLFIGKTICHNNITLSY